MTFKKDGVEIISNVFTKKECERIREEAYELTATDITQGGYKHLAIKGNNNKRQLAYFVALGNEYLNEIRTDKRLVKIVKTFLGNNVRQINNQIYYREPFDGEEFAWHQDTMFREKEYFVNPQKDYLQTIIAIDDITEDNGAIEFILGSHREVLETPQDLRKFERGERKGTKLTCKAGDVMVWDVNIIHGSEQNLSTRQRMSYMNGFARTENVTMYPHYLVNGEVFKNIESELIP